MWGQNELNGVDDHRNVCVCVRALQPTAPHAEWLGAETRATVLLGFIVLGLRSTTFQIFTSEWLEVDLLLMGKTMSASVVRSCDHQSDPGCKTFVLRQTGCCLLQESVLKLESASNFLEIKREVYK